MRAARPARATSARATPARATAVGVALALTLSACSGDPAGFGSASLVLGGTTAIFRVAGPLDAAGFRDIPAVAVVGLVTGFLGVLYNRAVMAGQHWVDTSRLPRELRAAIIGASVGALFARSTDLAEQVHQAMAARGFTGRLRDPAPSPLRASDVLIGLGCVIAAAALLWGDLRAR